MAKKKRQRRKAERPAEIIQAAMDELAEKGFADAKIQEIAARAGVAKGTVYLYFETKEQLFEAIVRDRIKPVFEQVQNMADHWTGPIAELLAEIIQRFYAEMIENEQRRMILKTLISESGRFSELASFYHREVIVGAREMLRNLIERGIEQGEFRPTPISKEPAVIMGPAMFAAVWKMTFDDTEKLKTKQFLQAHIDLIVHGLRK